MSKLSVYPLIDETTQQIFWDNTIVAWGTGVSTNGRLIPGWKPDLQCFHTCLLISKLSKWLSKWEYFALCLHIHVYNNRCEEKTQCGFACSQVLIISCINWYPYTNPSLVQPRRNRRKLIAWITYIKGYWHAKTILIVWWNHLKSSLLDACYSEVITESWTLISANDVEITVLIHLFVKIHVGFFCL